MNNVKKNKKLLFIFRHAPYGNVLAREAIDVALAASVYEQTLSIVFIDDGVFQLMNQQDTQALNIKNISHLLSAFELYDINSLFVCADSLAERGIEPDQLSLDIELLSREKLQLMLADQDHLLSF